MSRDRIERAMRVIALLGALLSASARAEPTSDAQRTARTALSLSVRFGVAGGPFYSERFPSVRGHGFVGVISGSYLVSAAQGVGLALPGAWLSVEQPAGAYIDKATWGNPTLFASDYRTLPARAEGSLRLRTKISLSLPLAEHGPSLQANRALAIASALAGLREQELFFPGRLSLAARSEVAFSLRRLQIAGGLKLPLLFKVSQASVPRGGRTHAVGFAPVVHTALGAELTGWFALALNADLVIQAVAPLEPARGPVQPLQMLLEPVLQFQLTRYLRLTADFLAPVAGPWAGSTYSGNLRLTAAW